MDVQVHRNGDLTIKIPKDERSGVLSLGHPNRITPAAQTLQVFYEQCEPDGKYRWWQTNWFSDQFDIIGADELEVRRSTAIGLGVKVTGHLPEEGES